MIGDVVEVAGGGLEDNADHHLPQAQPVAIAQAVGLVGVQALAVEEGAVAAAQVPDIQALVVGQAQGGVAAADAHPVAGIGRQVDIRHGPRRRVAAAKDHLLPGTDDQRLRRPLDLKAQLRTRREMLAACTGDQLARRAIDLAKRPGCAGSRHILQAGTAILTVDHAGSVKVPTVRANLHGSGSFQGYAAGRST